MTSDNIIEENETFYMNLDVSPSLGPAIIAGSVSSAIGIIIDSSSKTNIYELRILKLSYYNDRYHSKV